MNFLDKVLNTGLGLFQAQSQADIAKANAKAAAAANLPKASTSMPAWLPYAIGGVVLLILGVFLFKK